jgi:hypothetical protein
MQPFSFFSPLLSCPMPWLPWDMPLEEEEELPWLIEGEEL